MNATIFKTPRCLGLFALTALLSFPTARAADAPAPEPGPAATPATPADANQNQPGGRGNRGNTQRGNFGGGGGLNFDEKQRELLQEARQANRDDVRKLNEKLAEAEKEFVKAVVSEKYDEAVVREKADAVGKVQAEIMALNGKAFATVSPTLKPEQRESLEGNVRIGVAIINPGGGFGGPGGNFAGGAGGFAGGGGRGNFNNGGGGLDANGADRAFRRNDPNGGNGGGRGGNNGNNGNNRRRGGAPDAPGQ